MCSIPRLTQSPDYGSAHSPAFVNPGRTCYECGHCWRFGKLDHEPDRAPKGTDGAALHRRRKLIPGESRGEVGPLARSAGFSILSMLNAKVTEAYVAKEGLVYPLKYWL